MVNDLLKKSGMEANSPEEEQELVNSLLGELTNVVSGHVINTLTEYDLDITVPLIVQGPDHKINWPVFAPVNQVPIKTTLGEMELLVCFALGRKPARSP
jgi:chemotaxis protein CheX